MGRITRPRSRLASYSPNGRVWFNPNIPKSMRPRLGRHERVEFEGRKNGMTQQQAHHAALKAEHKGMTKHQIFVYEGKLGAIAKNHPAIHRKR